MTQLYTISAFTQNRSGVLHRLTAQFTRRKINIESLCVSETETKGISRFTISVKAEEELVQKIVAQISKIIEVVRVYYNVDEELIFREIALIKVLAPDATLRAEVEEHALRYGASVSAVTEDFIVIEKTGLEQNIESIYRMLEKYEIVGFVRSGRIALSRKSKQAINSEYNYGVRSDDGRG
jgi:acetolactate synthase I/III small subunit